MPSDHPRAPLVVGIGGSTRSDSLTDALLRAALDLVQQRGATTTLFSGSFLARLPIYAQDDTPPTEDALELAAAVSRADGILLASPGYHGAMSGLVKNGLDYLEILRQDARPYLDGRPVGVIVSAAGWQACGTAMVGMRSAVHALRGWPTPFAAAVNSAEPVIAEGGGLVPRVAGALQIVTDQLMDFVGWRRAAERSGLPG
jgi:FMN reductase